MYTGANYEFDSLTDLQSSQTVHCVPHHLHKFDSLTDLQSSQTNELQQHLSPSLIPLLIYKALKQLCSGSFSVARLIPLLIYKALKPFNNP